jgi:hypothetical protein
MEDDNRHYKSWGYGRSTLATLRLVNRTFCRIASPWLFRHIILRFHRRRGIQPLSRLKRISKSRYAKYVHQIDIGFNSNISYAFDTTTELYIEDLAGLLPTYLRKFTNLKALEFEDPPLDVREDIRKLYVKTVVSALRYVPLPKLEELEIRLPITRDFSQFTPPKITRLQIPIEKVMQGLRHLALHVCAYTKGMDGEDIPGPILPEHAEHPNNDYAYEMFSMLELATNLDSLKISSFNILDLDPFDIPSSLRLRCLHLEGVAISPEALLTLMNQSEETIRYINLYRVNLSSKTWYYVLLRMNKLFKLLDIQMEHCGYSGSSAHLNGDCRDIFQSIESCGFDDSMALGKLQRQVNANRVAAGLQPFSHLKYHWSPEPPAGLERDPYERSDNDYSDDDL